MSKEPLPHPIPNKERIAALDIIRGIALLGIFLANVPELNSPGIVYSLYGLERDYTGVDRIIRIILDLFIQGKFYTMFSFLFGVGFYIFMSRAEQKGLPIKRIFGRRLLALFVFGTLHLVFLWYGDILHLYAFTGFILLLFYRRQNKTILAWAFALLIIISSLYVLALLEPAPLTENRVTEQQQKGLDRLQEAINMYSHATYADWLSYHLKEEVSVVLANGLLALPVVLAMFLFGFYTGRQRIFEQIPSHLPFLRRVQTVSLILSLPFMALYLLSVLEWNVLSLHHPVVSQFAVFISGITLCFFYLSSLAIFLINPQLLNLLRPFGYVGQMALTNYLMQTVISVFVFMGLGYYGNVGLAEGIMFSLAIYALQIWFSSFWLRHFQFGPMEWVWRSLTYGTLQPLGRKHKK
jgi:uncharacterized protein